MRACNNTNHFQRVKWARIIGMVEMAVLAVENALEEAPENEELEGAFIVAANMLADLQEQIEMVAGGKIDLGGVGV
jgi:hypothetical protein